MDRIRVGDVEVEVPNLIRSAGGTAGVEQYLAAAPDQRAAQLAGYQQAEEARVLAIAEQLKARLGAGDTDVDRITPFVTVTA